MKIHDILAFNPSRYYLLLFLTEAAQSIQPGHRVLDAGAGDVPYKKLFSHSRYETTDKGLAYQTSRLDYVSDLTALPLQSGTYDHIICTQVMEHIAEPSAMLAEFYRVLKPGGKLWLSAPLSYPEHQIPHDYFRYTQFGLCYLHKKAGFTLDRIKPLEGLLGTLAYQCQKGALWLPLQATAYGGGRGSYLLLPLLGGIKLWFAMLSVLFAHLDRWKRIDRGGYCKNYTVIASKPAI